MVCLILIMSWHKPREAELSAGGCEGSGEPKGDGLTEGEEFME